MSQSDSNRSNDDGEPDPVINALSKAREMRAFEGDCLRAAFA